MADEASINCSLNISVGNYQYQNEPTSFTADVSSEGAAGPTPGSVLATITGTTIDLSKLTALGGLAVFINSDPTNYIMIGMYDPDTARFYPFTDILPGESYPLRLSRHFQGEFGAGTGTEGVGVTYQARVDPTQVAGTTAKLIVAAHNR